MIENGVWNIEMDKFNCKKKYSSQLQPRNGNRPTDQPAILRKRERERVKQHDEEEIFN